MKVRVLGAGFYGCHIARSLLAEGHDVEVWEKASRIFAGASGNIPARVHLGAPHYPRSLATQVACTAHRAEFMAEYGHLTRPVPVNIYAVAKDHSLIDFGTYKRALADLEHITLYDPAEFGVFNVEGAVMVPERHIVTDLARAEFEREIGQHVRFGVEPDRVDDPRWDMNIDCTFCANDAAGVDRYEPCLVVLLYGPTDRAVTIVDGPFGSLYPWNEDRRLCSLSSALWTPFTKDCKTWAEANEIVSNLTKHEIEERGREMIASMAHFYPAVNNYTVAEHRLSIRAMPLSGADTRLVDVVRVGERALRVRAGKIDAICHAAREISVAIAQHK